MDVPSIREGIVYSNTLDREKSLVKRLMMRMPSALASIKVVSNHPQYEEHMAAFAAATEKLSEQFSIPHMTSQKFDSDPSTDESSLSRILLISLLAERAATDLGRKAAIRAYRNIAMYRTRDPVEFHWNAAHAFLQRWGKKHGYQDLGEDRYARQCLGQAFHKQVTALYQNLSSYKPTMAMPPETEEKDGMLWCDALLFDLYERLGPIGQRDAEIYREKARSRWQTYQKTGDATHAWRFWCDFEAVDDPLKDDIGGGPPHRSHFDEVLLEILWDDQARYQWERATQNRPALPAVVADTLDRACWFADRALEVRDMVPSIVVEQAVIGTFPAAKIATVDGDVLATLERNVGLLGSLTGHRAIRFLVSTYHRQHFESADRNPTHIRIEGGLAGLARAIDERSKKAPDNLLKILQAGQALHIQWPGGAIGGLWTYVYSDKTGWGKKAFLEIRLGAALAPLYAKQTLPKSQQTLVPLIEVPPLVSPNKFYAQQAAFQFGLVRELVERRQEIHKEGGALLKEEDFVRIAAKYDLHESTRRKAMERWLRDGDDGPRVFELVDRSRYHLADNERYGDARRFIDETARMAAEARHKARRPRRRRDN